METFSSTPSLRIFFCTRFTTGAISYTGDETMMVELRRFITTARTQPRLLHPFSKHNNPSSIISLVQCHTSESNPTTTTPTPSIATAPLLTTTTTTTTRRKTLSILSIPLLLLASPSPSHPSSIAEAADTKFTELDGSGGVKALELRVGNGPTTPVDGDEVAIHYYGRLAAKQGWRFDSTYDHKDYSGEPIPFVFTLGSGKVIPGIEAAVRTMRVGGLRRVVIPPSQGYQTTTQEPIPPDFFDRQRLFTTIFNPTRLANGEGSTLGTLIFDIELIRLRHSSS